MTGKLRINGDITDSKVRVVDEEIGSSKIMSTDAAMAIAFSQNKDLVEINSAPTPSIVKIIDYDKFRYAQSKKEKAQRKKQKKTHITVKEIWIKPNIQSRDLNIKLDKIAKFLDSGNYVKLGIVFNGREVVRTNEMRRKLSAIITSLGSNVVSGPQELSSRRLTVIIRAI